MPHERQRIAVQVEEGVAGKRGRQIGQAFMLVEPPLLLQYSDQRDSSHFQDIQLLLVHGNQVKISFSSHEAAQEELVKAGTTCAIKKYTFKGGHRLINYLADHVFGGF
jgi:hypothetical protein